MLGTHCGAMPAVRFYGSSDLDAGAIRMSRANAERAGVAGITEFQELAIEDKARRTHDLMRTSRRTSSASRILGLSQ